MSSGELRRFGFIVAIPLALLASLYAWWGHTAIPLLLAGAAVTLAGLALAAPTVLGPVERGWMVLAHGLAWVNTRVLLSLIYYLVITPIGLMMRLVGRDPMDRRLGDRESYWVTRPQRSTDRRAMEHQF